MTQEEFIKKFCPDYEKKMELIESELVQSSNPVYHAAIEDSMFTEALQNFTNKVCEKQRETCVNDLDVFFRIQSIITYEKIKGIVSNSTTPKIEDL